MKLLFPVFLASIVLGANPASDMTVSNRYAYRGIQVFVISGDSEVNAYSRPSVHGFQEGTPEKLRRSGYISFPMASRQGYVFDLDPANWWRVKYNRKDPLDFYSLAIHELGHVLGLSVFYPAMKVWAEQGYIDDPDVIEYMGRPVGVDKFGHLELSPTFSLPKPDMLAAVREWRDTQRSLLLKRQQQIDPSLQGMNAEWSQDYQFYETQIERIPYGFRRPLAEALLHANQTIQGLLLASSQLYEQSFRDQWEIVDSETVFYRNLILKTKQHYTLPKECKRALQIAARLPFALGEQLRVFNLEREALKAFLGMERIEKQSALPGRRDDSNKAPPQLQITDIFGRVLNQKRIELVDWQGNIANPAVRLGVKATPEMKLPAEVTLRVSDPRFYFDLPSEIDSAGPKKKLTLTQKGHEAPFHLSVWPDANSEDGHALLTVELRDAGGLESVVAIPIYVRDEDKPKATRAVTQVERRVPLPFIGESPARGYSQFEEIPFLIAPKISELPSPTPFAIHLNYSMDVTNAFSGAKQREVIEQAANDWSEFLADQNFNTVKSGQEETELHFDRIGFTAQERSSSRNTKGEVDPLSLKAAFGAVEGQMPNRRWLITKLDLLILKAMGYRLGNTSAFENVRIEKEEIPKAYRGVPFQAELKAKGGVPNYQWTVETGKLPEGLVLDSFSGVIKGVPAQVGVFPIVVGLRDQQFQKQGMNVCPVQIRVLP